MQSSVFIGALKAGAFNLGLSLTVIQREGNVGIALSASKFPPPVADDDGCFPRAS